VSGENNLRQKSGRPEQLNSPDHRFFSINEFLKLHPKPDFFFSSDGKDHFFIYLGSDDLYVFSLGKAQPRRYSPLPLSVRKSIEKQAKKPGTTTTSSSRITTTHAGQATTTSEKIRQNIEKSIPNRNPNPYLNKDVLAQINPSAPGQYANKLFYLDKPISAAVENEYSLKYSPGKSTLKIIFPQAYDVSSLFHNSSINPKKIFLNKQRNLFLVVPDFLPGSEFYGTTYGKLKKGFSSLYLAKVSSAQYDKSDLYIRYIVKLCQDEGDLPCKASIDNGTGFRAIIISASLYDRTSSTVIETITLK
jgi:hypothetical protein